MPLFMCVAIEKPNKSDDVERLVHGPLPILAKDKEQAKTIFAVDSLPLAKVGYDTKRLEILVSPF